MDLVYCNCCLKTLSDTLIRCVECPDFDLCLECFACGVESGPHKKEHDYKVENVKNTLVFETENAWSLNEEHKLLVAVEQYGFGNWAQVAGHVKSRTAEACEEHFCAYYVNGNIGKATFPSETSSRMVDYSCPEGGPLSPETVHPLPPMDMALQEQQELGYMPLRNDFERECFNAAESAISGLSISADDDDLDVEMKLCSVSKYRMQLHERVRWKRTARNHRLISTSLIPGKNCRTPGAKRKGFQEDGHAAERMKVFAQLQTTAEHERLQEVLCEEKELRQKIDHLCSLRKRGLKELSEKVVTPKEKIKINGCKRIRRKGKIRYRYTRRRYKR
ncbi:transcriptional adapter 2-beta-like [Babylonia areolata]|uniref:transcriptional adapter 2-beta-like n=1 Tax=Babylonia areolata TaxID=304850 RepID=UPI003FD22F46